jgi:hypothetical protein
MLRSIVAASLMASAVACVKPPDTVLQQLMDARRLSADLSLQFTKTEDASNRAVMADTDAASITFAREAEQATQAIQKDVAAVEPVVSSLGFSHEAELIEEFNHQFDQYRALDHKILELAVENTNLKAQRLSFGPAQEAADTFRRSLEAVVPADPARDGWRAKALIATAVMNVREIQAQHAPHIAEPSDDEMTRLEKRMAACETEVRNTLKAIAGLASASSRSQITAASADFDRFVGITEQIVKLSRQNTNVRSLALSLGEKRTLAAACESSLRALQDGLSTRDFRATR